MDTEKGWIVALIFVLLVGGANLIAYALVRGAFRPGKKGMFENFTDSLNVSRKKKENEFEELSRRVGELKRRQDGDEEAD